MLTSSCFVVPSASSGDTTEEEDSEDLDLEKDTYCDPVGSLAAMNMVDSEDEDLSIDPYEQEQEKEKALVGSKPARLPSLLSLRLGAILG